MFRKFAENNIVVFDGAMGTAIQKAGLSEDIWRGKNGCNEFLNIVSPDTICNIHRRYFEAGADVAVTNTFGAISSVLKEYGLEDKVSEINKKGVEIARKAAEGMNNKFVALSVGPGTKLASLGHITYEELYIQYRQQAEAGIDADLYIVETCQDLIQIKAAVNACHDAACEHSKDMPVIVSFTVEKNGALLTGSDISAAAALMRGLNIFALGINCAMGPDMMKIPFAKLASCWGGKLYLSPNAGLPEQINGKTVYPMDGEKFGSIMADIIKEYPISIAGGCCGTDETHIKALRNAVNNGTLKNRTEYVYQGEASSLYTAVSLTQSPAPSMIGERSNATGSKKFREMLLAEDEDGIRSLCVKQEEEGAHFIDLSLAYAGRKEKEDYKKYVPILNESLTCPLVIDSTDPDTVREALERYSGKPIINSVNLEDGGKKLHYMFDIVKKHPACMVALTIDEKGMAQTCEDKVKIAERLYKIWTEDYGFNSEDLIIDPLTFSIGSGDETLKFAASETLKAIREIKKNLKGVKTVLGVSNVSFGLSPASRNVLNSVFLSEAVKAGLDLAIVHASKLIQITSLSGNDINICLNLINGKDGALGEFINHFALQKEAEEEKTSDSVLPPDEELSKKIIKGDKSGIKEIIGEIIKSVKPEDIINKILFPAMQKVGELFGAGKMLLPFVLQSAEAMKSAVAIIEPYMKKTDSAHKGTIVLATVQGDVHDIGKNLVDIILTNNGYKVYNLGIKVPVSDMVQKAIETDADAIGMSGLLVKSTLVMKDNITEISNKIPHIKIMLGGAALTGKYVEESCAPIMPGKVYYCRDAFDNIGVMNDSIKASGKDEIKAEKAAVKIEEQEKEKDTVKTAEIPLAPFFGTKIINDTDISEIFEYVNKASLFSVSWGYKKKGPNDKEYEDMLQKVVLPEFNNLKEKIINEKAAEPKAIYGYFRAKKCGNIVELFSENTEYAIASFSFPIRKIDPYISIADYFYEKDDKYDVMPIQIVTLGNKPAEYCKKLFEADNYKEYFMTHGLFTSLTDAFAEVIHKRIRNELGIGGEEGNIDAILRGKYRGKRYSFGYPMAPDTENNEVIAGILGAERIGVEISSQYQMMPEYTTSAFIIHHPDAAY